MGPERLTYAELSGLPTDPAALRRRLFASPRLPQERRAEVPFARTAERLRTTPVPYRVRAALYEALRGVPGVRDLGRVRYRGRRSGVGLEQRMRDGLVVRLVFEPSLFTLLAEEHRLARRVDWVDAAPGTLIAYRWIESQAFVRGEDRDP
jgi:hypothetical protein